MNGTELVVVQRWTHRRSFASSSFIIIMSLHSGSAHHSANILFAWSLSKCFRIENGNFPHKWFLVGSCTAFCIACVSSASLECVRFSGCSLAILYFRPFHVAPNNDNWYILIWWILALHTLSHTHNWRDRWAIFHHIIPMLLSRFNNNNPENDEAENEFGRRKEKPRIISTLHFEYCPNVLHSCSPSPNGFGNTNELLAMRKTEFVFFVSQTKRRRLSTDFLFSSQQTGFARFTVFLLSRVHNGWHWYGGAHCVSW